MRAAGRYREKFHVDPRVVVRPGDGVYYTASTLSELRVVAETFRGAMATDSRDPCGVYVGSTSGTVHISSDRGDSWQTLPCTLPRVLSVRVFEE